MPGPPRPGCTLPQSPTDDTMDTLSFDNGDEMPLFGLGTWKSDPGLVYDAVQVALEAGYRHVDCAPIYGNETEVGQALRDAFDNGGVVRDDVWITSKLWNDAHRPEVVRQALEETLEDLQLETLDLYLMHWPVALEPGVDMPESPDDLVSLRKQPLAETWEAMEALKEEGLARHIGVSNFSLPKLRSLIETADQPPEMNQIELHPYLQQQDLVEYAQVNDVHVTAYSPLGSRDRSSIMKKDDEPILFDHPTIQEVAEKHDCTVGQVLISWAVHRQTAVIPKSTNPGRIKENLASANVHLDDADMDKIASIDQQYRFVDGSFWAMEGSPYSLSDLWG